MGPVPRRRATTVVVAAALCLAGCGGGDGAGEVDVDGEATMEVSSSDLVTGATVPVRFTCDGEDARPALAWGEPPDGTTEVVVVVDDPDAPGGTFTHWTVWGLDPADTPIGSSLPGGAIEGTNGFGSVGWRGPCPPRGADPHRYRFRVLAVDTPVGLSSGATPDAVDRAIRGHVLAEGHLIATYSR